MAESHTQARGSSGTRAEHRESLYSQLRWSSHHVPLTRRRRLELLRSYRIDEWRLWFRAAGIEPPSLRGWMFDSSLALMEAAARGVGVALVPVAMFGHEIEAGRIAQPFGTTVHTGSYWLTRLKSRAETASMKAFRRWLVAEADDQH